MSPWSFRWHDEKGVQPDPALADACVMFVIDLEFVISDDSDSLWAVRPSSLGLAQLLGQFDGADSACRIAMI
jgi:hypothetical protein